MPTPTNYQSGNTNCYVYLRCVGTTGSELLRKDRVYQIDSSNASFALMVATSASYTFDCSLENINKLRSGEPKLTNEFLYTVGIFVNCFGNTPYFKTLFDSTEKEFMEKVFEEAIAIFKKELTKIDDSPVGQKLLNDNFRRLRFLK